MSKILNSRLRQLKDLEVQLRGIATQGRLSPQDSMTYCRAITLQVAIFSDLSLGYSWNYGAWVRWARFMAHTDPYAIGLAIKSLQLQTRNYVPGWKWDYETFKQSQPDPVFVGAFLAPIKRTVIAFLQDTTPGTFGSVNQFLSFLSRLNLASINLRDNAVRDWRNDEVRLKSLKPDPVIVHLNRIMKEWLTDWTPPEPCDFKHGPGGTAEIRRSAACKEAKQPLLKADALLRYCGMTDWNHGKIDRTNKIVFVAKSMTSWRTISMEPTSLQYFQQGVWSSFDRLIGTNPVLRTRIHLHDQSYNRNAAQLGSADPASWATVDLTAASDTITWSLVKGVFKGTKVLRYLTASRSRISRLPGGERVEVAKFAPMGSAVCFPVECLVFAACCEHIKRSWADTRNFLVFGDDIVVPAEWTQELYPLLDRLGFRVNTNKSFRAANLPFRESCGGEFYYGSDVTPVRLSRKFCYWNANTLRSSAEAYSSAVELCNTFHERRWRVARMLILEDLLRLPQHLRPLFDDGQKGIATDMPTNHHLSTWYDESYQGRMAMHGSPLSSCEDGGDDLRYYEDRRLIARSRCKSALEMLYLEPAPVKVGATEASVGPQTSRVFFLD